MTEPAPDGDAAGRAPRHRPLVVALVLGLLVQVVLVYRGHDPAERRLVGDEQTYAAEAAKLAAGEPLAPTFVNPPLYAWVLAAVFRVFGQERIAVELLQSALLLFAAFLLWGLLGAAGLGPPARAAGLALFLLDPQVAAFAQYLWPEVLHLALALLGLWLLVAARPSGSASAFLAGGAFGLAVLAKSLLMPFLPVLIGAAAVTAASPASRARGLRAVAFAGGLLVLLVPVVVTNGLRHGYWGIANSGPFNAWVGINDPANRHDYESVVQPAMAEYLALSPDPVRRNRAVSLAVGRTILRRGPLAVLGAQVEKQYGRLFDRESFFTDQLPGGRLQADAPPQPRDSWLRAWAYGAYAIVLLLAGLGLGLAGWRRSARRLTLPALFLAYNLALFLLLHVKTRYRFAFLPCLVFFGALAIDRLATEPRLLSSARGKARFALGLLAGGALLLLAFGRAWPPA